MKLIAKFLLAFVVTSLVVLLASGYLRVEREVAHFDEDLRSDVSSYARSLAHAVSVLSANVSQNEAAQLVRRAAEPAQNLVVRWVALSDNANFDQPLAPASEVAGIRAGNVRIWNQPQTPQASGALVAYAPLEQELQGVGRTAIEVNESLEVRDRFIRGTIRSTALTMALALAATAGVAIVLGVTFVGGPLHAMALKVKRIGQGDLTGPLRLRQRDEIGEVARELNAMCEQLGEKQRKLEAEMAARLAVQEQLRHADRLATVGGLASGIAHEIGTPLAVVAGRGKMIASGEVTGEEALDNARIVVEQTQRISKIIRQLLDFARRRPAQKGRVDLVTIVNKTLALLEPMALKRGVRTKVNVPSSGAMPADIDVGQIEQSLTNLVVNAIQASERGGTIEVTLGRGHAAPPAGHGVAAGEFISVSVADTGAGMDGDTVKHVFEPFFTTKDVGEGTGLGVAYDARLVAATNRDLELAVEEHRFREDLFYRINVLHVHLPPLRERGSDILLLAQHFVTRCADALHKPVTGLTPEAAERLMVYGWPGNVRELSNCVERAVALTRFDRIVVDDLPEKVRAYRPSRVLLGGEDPVEVLPLEEVERRYILWAVDTIGNRTQAAQRLGLDRKTLYRKLARYDHPKKRDIEGGSKS